VDWRCGYGFKSTSKGKICKDNFNGIPQNFVQIPPENLSSRRGSFARRLGTPRQSSVPYTTRSTRRGVGRKKCQGPHEVFEVHLEISLSRPPPNKNISLRFLRGSLEISLIPRPSSSPQIEFQPTGMVIMVINLDLHSFVHM